MYVCVMLLGTGDVKDRGAWVGKNYAVNVPLHDGMDDDSYRAIFRPVISKVGVEVVIYTYCSYLITTNFCMHACMYVITRKVFSINCIK